MKFTKFTEKQASAIKNVIAVLMFCVLGWSLLEDHLVGSRGNAIKTPIQSVEVSLKGTTLFVTPQRARTYALSHKLTKGVFLLVLVGGLVSLFQDLKGRR
jgi:hypothetical protein